jgi:ubiquinone/menaquinone biosynthesis C-methylase UbiE
VPASKSEPWGSSYRLVAAEKWKAKSARMGRDVTLALVEFSDPKPGMQVLDLAAGTGEPGITVAGRVGSHGRVVAVDQSSDLLELASGRARDRSLSNFLTHTCDAHTLPFEDETFDLATCRFGVMFFRDPTAALSELRRVLKPGARACFVAWGTFEQPYWQTTVKVVHKHTGGNLLEPDAPDPFRFAEPGSLSRVLKAARFDELQESTRDVSWTWPGPSEEVFEYVCAVSAPFRPMLDRVREEQWPAIREEARAAIEKYQAGDEIRFGSKIVFAAGKKPASRS